MRNGESLSLAWLLGFGNLVRDNKNIRQILAVGTRDEVTILRK